MVILTNKQVEDLNRVVDILSKLKEEFIVSTEDFKIAFEKAHKDQEIEDIERTIKSLEKYIK